MELLVWHAALGCDDEQASDAELRARVLFAHPPDSSPLQALRLAQALMAFAQRLVSSESSNWLSVTLSRRRFFLQEVEPQVFMALGVAQATELREHRFVYGAVMRDLYGMFRLFHGSFDSNLRQIPSTTTAEAQELPQVFADGMELLRAIQAARKRIRKLDLALEQAEQTDEDDDDSARRSLESERASAQSELDALLQLSPATRLEARCRDFFPVLLRALDACHASSLHELIGIGQLPVDPATFLSLQSFLNAFRLDLAGAVRSSALFFKGNLLWSSMDPPTLQLLYRFLRLREEYGMEIEAAPSPSPSLHSSQNQSSRAGSESVWMTEKYRDTFLPIWSSKTSYAECTVVNHARRHPRKTVRSLHRQSPSPLSTVVTDANGPLHSGSGSSSNSSKSREDVDERADPLASPRKLSRSALKARIKSVAYRNTGLLMKNGYFAKTFELPIRSRGRGKFSESQAVDFIWKPQIFPIGDKSSVGNSRDEPQHYAAVWHEADLTMVLLMTNSHGEVDENRKMGNVAVAATLDADEDAAAAQVLEMLRRVEDAMDRLKFHELAKLVASQSSRSNSNSSSSNSIGGGARSPSSSAAYPFVYLNRANMTFKALQIPRLIRSKDPADLFPLPLRLLANYLPQQTLDLLNALHGELQKCGRGETRDVCVKTLHDGWVLGKKSDMTQRELYAFFDTKVPSVVDLSDALEDLLQDQLGNVFF